jgi:hypothetical protein
VYLAAFAFLTFAGAWGAWHSNPTYSTQRTIRYLAVTLLGIACCVGVIAGTVVLTEHSPFPVAIGAMSGAVLACTLGLIWLIVTAVQPKPAALPTSMKLVTVHRKKLGRWLQRFGWLVAGCAALAVVLPGEAKIFVYTIGGIAISLGIVLLFTGYLAASAFDRALTSVESDPWIHWRYTPEQWKAWGDAEIARLATVPASWIWRRDWKRFATSFAVVAIAVFALNSFSVPWQWNAGTVAVAGLVMFGCIEWSVHYGSTAPYRLRRLLSSAAPEAFFGDAGMFADGVFVEWLSLGTYLIEADLDERVPRCLAFLFEKYTVGTSGGTIQERHNVLLPPEADADVALLQTKLSALCPKANVVLVASG